MRNNTKLHNWSLERFSTPIHISFHTTSTHTHKWYFLIGASGVYICISASVKWFTQICSRGCVEYDVVFSPVGKRLIISVTSVLPDWSSLVHYLFLRKGFIKNCLFLPVGCRYRLDLADVACNMERVRKEGSNAASVFVAPNVWLRSTPYSRASYLTWSVGQGVNSSTTQLSMDTWFCYLQSS